MCKLTQEERQEKLETIVKHLMSNDYTIDKDELLESANKLNDLYKDDRFRHRYSGITRCIYSNEDNLGPQRYEDLQQISQQADRLVFNLGGIMELM